MSRTILAVDDVTRAYGSVAALDGVTLTVEEGEFIALVGPSGCGKSTLLKLIAGFEEPTEGRISIAGRPMSGVPAAARPTSLVFQKLALFPHMTVAENIGFPLKLRRVAAAERAERTAAMLRLMQLKPEYLDRYPRQLSGGEQQRVALARSMISEPALLLLDEPLSALDVKLKKVLQSELKRLHRELGVTFVHVTHDLEEAMMLADRICIMRAGRILQLGRPDEIYYRPTDAFVAGFIGETNLLPVSLIGAEGGGDVTVEATGLGTARLPASQVAPGLRPGPALLMIRPELIRIGPPGTPGTLGARVAEMFLRGSTILYRLAADGAGTLTVEVPGAARPPAAIGDRVAVSWDDADAYLMPAEAA